MQRLPGVAAERYRTLLLWNVTPAGLTVVAWCRTANESRRGSPDTVVLRNTAIHLP